MFNFGRNKVGKENMITVESVISNMEKELEERASTVNDDIETDKTMKRLGEILKRKDIIDFESDKIDALRMFYHYIKNDEMNASGLVKFLKS